MVAFTGALTKAVTVRDPRVRVRERLSERVDVLAIEGSDVRIIEAFQFFTDLFSSHTNSETLNPLALARRLIERNWLILVRPNRDSLDATRPAEEESRRSFRGPPPSLRA